MPGSLREVHSVTDQKKLRRALHFRNSKRAFSRAYSRLAEAVGEDIFLMDMVNKVIYRHSEMVACKAFLEECDSES